MQHHRAGCPDVFSKAQSMHEVSYIYIYIFFVLSLASQTGLINVSKAASSSPAGGGGFAADFADGRGGGKPAAEPVGKMARDVRSIGTPPPPNIYTYI